MDFFKLSSEARSCRRFDGSKELPTDTLSWLVDCARVTPSAANLQVMRYITIQDKAVRENFYPSLAWAGYLKEWNGPIEAERPTGYIVFMVKQEEGEKITLNTCIDVGITAQTIQLAAWSKGISACMFRAYNPKKMAEAITMPENYETVLVMALGYPIEDRRIVPVDAEGSIRYYRDEQGIHYVPKRKLEDIILAKY